MWQSVLEHSGKASELSMENKNEKKEQFHWKFYEFKGALGRIASSSSSVVEENV